MKKQPRGGSSLHLSMWGPLKSQDLLGEAGFHSDRVFCALVPIVLAWLLLSLMFRLLAHSLGFHGHNNLWTSKHNHFESSLFQIQAVLSQPTYSVSFPRVDLQSIVLFQCMCTCVCAVLGIKLKTPHETDKYSSS